MRRAALLSDVFAVLGVAGAALVVCGALAGRGLAIGHGIALAFLAAGCGSSILAQLRLHRVTDEREAHRAIAPVVDTFVLVTAAMATALKPDWWPSMAAFLIVYRIAMTRRPMREQI